MSAAFITTSIVNRSIGGREPDALVAREVDGLVSKLLGEMEVPFSSIGKRVLNQVADLKKVLAADYLRDTAMPSKELLRELGQEVEKIKSYDGQWNRLDSPEVLTQLYRKYGYRDIELRAEPYRRGAGLSLRGFFCRSNVGNRNKFVIFVNTAHHPAAAAATLGHELGHYIYGSLAGEKSPMTAFMEGTFASHLKEEDELFADSLVALAAYSRKLIEQSGALNRVKPGESAEFFASVRRAYSLIAPRFNLDLAHGQMAAAWRMRYITSMTHFIKLRSALYQTANI